MKLTLTFRKLDMNQLEGAFPLLLQLRPHLTPALFQDLYAAQIKLGYELHGAFLEDKLVGLAGMRTVTSLARGPHLHLDDLVIASGLRSKGLGGQLLAYAEHQAASRGLGKLFLDARKEAIPFYEHEGYSFHPAPLMAKEVRRRDGT